MIEDAQMHKRRLYGLAIMCCTWAVVAQEAPTHRCASVLEPLPRLACYDASFPPAQAVRAVEASRGVREFGHSADKVSAAAARRSSPAQLSATVLAVTYQADGTRTVSLDTHQRWALTEASSRGHLAEGDVIVLRKAAMGSYMLVTAAGVALRARRID
ncbi:hypothetical protein [Xanthomonas hortorum]|uniref:Uncharacterized protein n=1 Tax=Xanthomonas hortorum pv. pelargonii TaxID=453602 RepID=A0A6V7E2I9_9XANT|nr:hypothetical protein CFBP2533_30490 [Xanthomonas hortorum pv. pelargonii]CAD0345102.1 hypothetical protein CFBP2533_30490 [Xanthomonas hortorum pv. pelargonii]